MAFVFILQRLRVFILQITCYIAWNICLAQIGYRGITRIWCVVFILPILIDFVWNICLDQIGFRGITRLWSVFRWNQFVSLPKRLRVFIGQVSSDFVLNICLAQIFRGITRSFIFSIIENS